MKTMKSPLRTLGAVLAWLLCLALGTGCASESRRVPSVAPALHPVTPVTARPAPQTDRVVHVDALLRDDSCTTYSPAQRRCGAGEGLAFKRLSEAASAAAAGDTVLLRAGTYSEQLKVATAGAPDRPITFRPYPGEIAEIAGVDAPAIFLVNAEHVVLEGLRVRQVLGWGRLENCARITIRGNHFSDALARGTTGGLKLVRSVHNRIEGNTFVEGNDSLVVQESDSNLIVGNSFRNARHSLLSIRCGSYNIVRGNRFYNEYQKAAEIYDCEAVSDAPFKLDATQRNLFEGNRFTFTRGPSQPHNYNAVQYCPQLGIVRRNWFHDNQGGGVNFQVYAQEALYVYGNRVYHNTFFANRCYGLGGGRGPGLDYEGNLVLNNIFYRNEGCGGEPVQVDLNNPLAVQLGKNALLDPEQAPGFVSAPERDLRLASGSPMVDAGAFLTRATAAGSGVNLPVDDVLFFSDGYGIDGEPGDLVQLEGDTARARVVGIDYVTRTLTLSTPLRWRQGQGLSLAYSGIAPDLGAEESGLP